MFFPKRNVKQTSKFAFRENFKDTGQDFMFTLFLCYKNTPMELIVKKDFTSWKPIIHGSHIFQSLYI